VSPDDLPRFLAELNALFARYGLGPAPPPWLTPPSCQPVTLDQCAAMVRLTKKALYRYRERGMPRPVNSAANGRRHLYEWSEMRPWLERTFGLSLPEVHPSCRAG
jgi:hypothetical protein